MSNRVQIFEGNNNTKKGRGEEVESGRKGHLEKQAVKNFETEKVKVTSFNNFQIIVFLKNNLLE